jgi:type VI secretion system secreted protein VgrG
MGGTGTTRSQGNQADYLLGTTEGWNAFGVVRWHGIEELSQPYRYEITLQRQVSTGAADLDSLIDSAATFAVASQSTWRLVHGILAEAEEIDRTTQLILYRVLLVPPFWRARYRRRCRNFHKKSLKDLVSSVLENKSPAHPQGMGGLTRFSVGEAPAQNPSFSSFSPPTGTYRWDVKDTSRIEDRMVRPYVVQYNETDFDFVARLLEDEGLTYYFEHAQDQVVLAITDMPGVSPMFDNDATFTQRRVSTAGTSQNQEIVRTFRDTRRLRSRAVMVRDWDYFRSAAPLEAKDEDTTQDPDLSRHFEFPVGEEAVQSQPGQHAATVRKQRYDAERSLREGSSTLRTMVPGYRFTLQDADGINPEQQLLAVGVETYSTELTPQGTVLDEEPFGFANTLGTPTVGDDSRFLALSQSVPFRPAMRTPRPRINGVQAAVVTAEEFPEGDRPVINGDPLGRVRVRFPWDQRPDTGDQTPTSCWIRVSQFWAGAGYGALYTPRVGHEVLVAYMQGDPDKPVIVGRVYNAQHTPPYDAQKQPTQSTVKSQSAQEKQEVDGFNEIRFEDKAKKEQIYLHAQRNLDEVVLASHSTSVGGDQSNFVGHDQTNKVKGHREHTIDDYETVTVGDDRTTLFKANESHTVQGERDTSIGINDNLNVGAWHNTKVGGSETFEVGGKRDVTVLGGDYTVKTTAGSYVSEASANHAFESTNTYIKDKGDFQVVSTTAGFNQKASYYVHAGTSIVMEADSSIDLKAGSARIAMRSGQIHLDNGAGSKVVLVGGLVVVDAGTVVYAKAGAMMTLDGGPVVNIKAGAAINATAGAVINGKAANIKLNG